MPGYIHRKSRSGRLFSKDQGLLSDLCFHASLSANPTKIVYTEMFNSRSILVHNYPFSLKEYSMLNIFLLQLLFDIRFIIIIENKIIENNR